MDNKECEESDIYAQISSLLLQDGGAGQCEFRGEITGGIINKAGLFNVNGKETFVKYATRQNVSTCTTTIVLYTTVKEYLHVCIIRQYIAIPLTLQLKYCTVHRTFVFAISNWFCKLSSIKLHIPHLLLITLLIFIDVF